MRMWGNQKGGFFPLCSGTNSEKGDMIIIPRARFFFLSFFLFFLKLNPLMVHVTPHGPSPTSQFIDRRRVAFVLVLRDSKT